MNQELTTRPLFKRFPVLLLTLALLAAAAFLLTPIQPQSLLFEALLNAGHVWLFFTLTLLALIIAKPQTSKAFFLLGVLILGFGIGMELTQPLAGRSANVDDMAKNMLGMTAAILLYGSAGLTHAEKKLKPLLIAGAGLILISSLIRPMWQLAANYSLASMPIIADFESSFSLERINALGNTDFRMVPPKQDGNPFESTALLAEMKPAPYSGFRIVEPHSTWSEMTTFQFQIHNPGDASSELVIRIEDAHHNMEYSDRFNRMFTIAPGLNTIVIPINEILHMGQEPGLAGRKMDLYNIASVMFYAVSPVSTTRYYFDNLLLE